MTESQPPEAFKPNKVVISLVLAFALVAQLLTFFLLYRALVNIHWYFTGPRLDLTDFSQFYQAGQLIISPHSHRVYDPDVQEWWCLGLIYPQIPIKGLFYNQSVPFLYLFCIPYGLLPYNLAYVVWCLTTGLMALSSLFLLLKESLKGLKTGLFIPLFLVLAWSSIPAYLTVWHGQTTFLLVTCMSLSMCAFLRGRDILSGVFLSLSTVKPQYILLPLATMFGLRKWRLLAALFATEAALFLLAGCFMGFDTILNYPRVLVSAESSTRFVGVNPHVMASLRGLLSVLLPHKTAMLITTLTLFASLIPVAWLAFKTPPSNLPESLNPNRSVNRRFLLAFIFTLSLVLSPHSHYFDCLLLTIPAALTLRGMLLAESDSESEDYAQWKQLKAMPQYRWWCRILVFYPFVSWFYNFALGSMEAEGIAFLLTNTLLAVLCANIFLATRSTLSRKEN